MIDSLIEPTGSLPFLRGDSFLTVMKEGAGPTPGPESSRGDNEEVEDVRRNLFSPLRLPQSLSVSASRCQRNISAAVETAALTSDLGAVSSKVKNCLNRRKRSPEWPDEMLLLLLYSIQIVNVASMISNMLEMQHLWIVEAGV